MIYRFSHPNSSVEIAISYFLPAQTVAAKKKISSKLRQKYLGEYEEKPCSISFQPISRLGFEYLSDTTKRNKLLKNAKKKTRQNKSHY